MTRLNAAQREAVEHVQGPLLVLAGAGLIYSLFILFELRMSPNLHRWIYGFGQHGFSQHIRWGGYRPMVFMAAGLAVALFITNALMAAGALTRLRRPILRVHSPLIDMRSLVARHLHELLKNEIDHDQEKDY